MGLNDDDFMRFSRQVLLPEVGEHGQKTLAIMRVTVIGIGGLGHLVSNYLAAGGVGQLTLIDHDIIEVSNLPRQLLFCDEDIGQFKSGIAKAKLAKANPHCDIKAITAKVVDENISDLLAHSDLVLDCTDDFSTRQLINSTCVERDIPLIIASVANFKGQLLIVDLNHSPDSGCYQCLFPADSVVTQNCQTVGVLGPMVGVMASMQSLLAMNYLLGLSVPLGKLFIFDGLKVSWQEMGTHRDLLCATCEQSHTETAQC